MKAAQYLLLLLIAIQVTMAVLWFVSGKYPNAAMWAGIALANAGAFVMQGGLP